MTGLELIGLKALALVAQHCSITPKPKPRGLEYFNRSNRVCLIQKLCDADDLEEQARSLREEAAHDEACKKAEAEVQAAVEAYKGWREK